MTYQSLSPNPQEWSVEQKEIWKCLEDKWEHLIHARLPEFLDYIDEDFRGFGHESALMLDKKWLTRWVGFWSETTKFPIHYISPISCGVYGDFAIIQYIIFTVEKNLEGGRRSARRYTMTWRKRDGKWKVLASHNNLMSDHV